MTVATETIEHQFVSSGALTPVSVPFTFAWPAHVLAFTVANGAETPLIYGAHYQVTGNGRSGAGQFVPLVAIAAGTVVRMRRRTPRAQQFSSPTAAPGIAASLEVALDDLTMMVQEVDGVASNVAAEAVRSVAGTIPPRIDPTGFLEGDLLQVRGGKIARLLSHTYATKFLAFDNDGRPFPSAGTGADAGLRQDLAEVTGAMLVYTNGDRSVSEALAESGSMEEFRTSNSAAGDKAAFEQACMQYRFVHVSKDVMNLTGAVIPADAKVERIYGHNVRVNIFSPLNAISITILKKQFLSIDGLRFWSASGTKTDGMNVSAIVWDVGCSYQSVSNCYFRHISGACLTPVQCVEFRFSNNETVDCNRMHNFQSDPLTGIQCTAVTVLGGYLSGCTDAFYGVNSITNLFVDHVRMEYCGSVSSPNHAAVNIQGGAVYFGGSCYYEANYKSHRLKDCLWLELHPMAFVDAPWTSTYEWEGTDFSQRGYALLTNRFLRIAEIRGDPTTGGLQIMGNVGFGTSPSAGIPIHAMAPEFRLRMQSSNAAGFFDMVVGGGGALFSGLFSLTSHLGGNRILFDHAVTEGLRITGAGGLTELWLNGERLLKTPRTGWTRPTGTATRTAFDTATVTLPRLAEAVKALIDDFHADTGHGALKS